LNSIATVITQNILPIFVVASFGFGLQRWRRLDKRTVSTVVLNCLSPALVFSSLVNSQLPGEELFELSTFALLTILLNGLLTLLLARLIKLSRTDTVALLIVVMFVNGGNYGMTLNQLRYGDAGLARAVVYFITSTLLVYTVGLLIASMGELSWRQAVSKLLRLPAAYAAVAAVVVYSFEINVPAPLMKGIEVAGTGAIPVMILVLGMQMADWHGAATLRLAIPAMFMRMLAGPLVGTLMASVVGLEGLGRSTSIIEASMPTAVVVIVIATEFDLQPSAVTSIVLLTTLLSPLTVAGTISILGL
jgi:predicted permease